MNFPRLRHRPRREGQAIVEFALIFPIFVLLLVLIIDLGMYYYIESTMSHAVRMTLRDAVVGRHHRGNMTVAEGGTTPRAKLITLAKKYVGPSAGFIKLTANMSATAGTGDTLVFTPADCYNSDEYITVEMRQNHKFMTPMGSIVKYFGATGSFSGNANIVVRTTYRSENFQEHTP